jgi:hypothetical protein
MQLQASFEIKQVLNAKKPSLLIYPSSERYCFGIPISNKSIGKNKKNGCNQENFFERDNDQGIIEVIRFYCKETVQAVLSQYNNSFLYLHIMRISRRSLKINRIFVLMLPPPKIVLHLCVAV